MIEYPETMTCFWCKGNMILEEVSDTCAVYYCQKCDERETEPMENHSSEGRPSSSRTQDQTSPTTGTKR